MKSYIRKPRRWPPERVARLRELTAQKLSYSALAAELGATRAAIGAILRRNGLRSGNPLGRAPGRIERIDV